MCELVHVYIVHGAEWQLLADSSILWLTVIADHDLALVVLILVLFSLDFGNKKTADACVCICADL